MSQYIGYTALFINLVSMSMNSVFYLRICAVIANTIYIVYGIMIDAPPIYLGCSAAVALHSFRLLRPEQISSSINEHFNKENMEKKTNNTTSIRNVYFTDLNHIKSIYHQNTKLNKLHIGEDFGLPLALIETKGEVIAYATIIFNNQTAPEICIKFKSEAEQEDYKQSLHQYAGKVLESMQSEGKGDYNKLEPYIQRLVDWLNLCN